MHTLETVQPARTLSDITERELKMRDNPVSKAIEKKAIEIGLENTHENREKLVNMVCEVLKEHGLIEALDDITVTINKDNPSKIDIIMPCYFKPSKIEVS